MTKEKSKSFLAHAAIYGIGAAALQLSSAVLLPLYTHYLSPADYGVLEILDRLGGVINLVLLGNGIRMATFSFYCQAKSPQERAETFASIFSLLWAILIVGMLATVSLSTILAQGLGIDDPALVVLGTLVVLLQAAASLPLTVMQARTQSVPYVIASVLMATCRLVCVILAVAVFDMGLWGALGASALCYMLFAVVLTIREAARGISRPDRSTAWAIIRFSLPLLPTGIFAIVLSTADRFFLVRYASVSDVGIYALGYKLAVMIPQLATLPFWNVWSARLFDMFDSPNSAQLVGRTVVRLLAVQMFCCLGVSILSSEAVRILAPPDYASATRVMPILATASLFYFAANLFDGSFLARRNTKPKPFIAMISTSVGVGLLFLWVPNYGAIGAAFSIALAHFARATATLILAQRVSFIQLDWLAIGKGLVFAVTLFSITSLLPPSTASTFLKVVAWMAWPVMLWLFGGLDDQEQLWLQRQAKRLKELFQH